MYYSIVTYHGRYNLQIQWWELNGINLLLVQIELYFEFDDETLSVLE